jgi:hypothetical protein
LRLRQRSARLKANFDGHVSRFLTAFPSYRDWTIEKVGLSPALTSEGRRQLQRAGVIAQDLTDLLSGL